MAGLLSCPDNLIHLFQSFTLFQPVTHYKFSWLSFYPLLPVFLGPSPRHSASLCFHFRTVSRTFRFSFSIF